MKQLTLVTLVLGASLAAQTGTFVPYGTSCSGGGGASCVSANDTAPIVLGAVTGASANFAIRSNSGSTTRVICGFQLYTRTSNAATTAVDAWIYDASSGAPNNMLAATKIQMTPTQGWQVATFSTPVIINANTDFFLVFSNLQARCNPLPIISGGTNQVHYWNGPPSWSGPWATNPWVYQVLCCGGGPAPAIGNTGVPTINQSFSIDLSNAPANANSLLAIGVGKTNIDLSIIGAPGCTLYTNPLLILAAPTNSAGARAQTLALPNDPALVNFKFHCQYGVASGANPAGILFSDGGEATVGK